jgi:uncharacterized protein
MKLQISQLHEGENPFRFDSEKDVWLKDVVNQVEKEGYKVLTPLKSELSLTKLEPDFYLKGSLNFSVEQNCARCAEAFPLKVQHPFAIALARSQSAKVQKTSLTEESEELDVNFFEGKEIDLNPILGEQFFLSIPYQSLCRADCKGVCQECGVNLNTVKCGCTPTIGINPFAALESFQL